MKARLLVRPYPLPDESIYSWLSRLSSANASRNKKRILELFDGLGSNKRIKSLPTFDEKRLASLSDLTSVPVQKIYEMLWCPEREQQSSDGANFRRQFLFSQRARVCPVCVDEGEYWRKSWQLLPITCCPDHGVRLVTSCKCGKPISIYSVSLTRCACGRNYSKQQRITPANNELALAEYLYSAYRLKPNEVLVNRLYDVFFCLWWWYQSTRNHNGQLIRSWNHSRILRGVKYVGGLLRSHYVDIEPLMLRVIGSRGQGATGFRKSLGDCHDYMRNMEENGYTGELVEALKSFEEGVWYGSEILKRSRYGHDSMLETRRELLEREKVGSAKLDRVISYSDIEPIKSQCKARRVYLHKNDRAAIRSKLEDWMSLGVASEHVGLSEYQVKLLAKSNLIVGKKGANRDWLISKKSFLNLINELDLGCAERISPKERVSLNIVQKYPGFSLPAVLIKCLYGELRYCLDSESASLGKMIFSKLDIEELRRQEQGGLLSAQQVAQHLDININAVYYLVKKRFLRKSFGKCRNRKVIAFSWDDIEIFSARYCFYRDVRAFFIDKGRIDLVASLKPVNYRCQHKSKIRVYSWELLNRSVKSVKSYGGDKGAVSRLFSLEDSANYVGISVGQLKSYVSKEWIIPYQSPSHHKSYANSTVFTRRDLDRLKMIFEYPSLMPLRAVAKYLGVDRSNVRKQYLMSGYLDAERIPELPKEIFCLKQQVFALGRLLRRTLTGPELAEKMGVTRNTIYRWMTAGKLFPVVTPNDKGFGFYRYENSFVPNS